MGVKNMQGVPAHIEYLQDSERKRRDLRRCKHIIKPQKVCNHHKSLCFNERCFSSKHCNFYEEK